MDLFIFIRFWILCLCLELNDTYSDLDYELDSEEFVGGSTTTAEPIPYFDDHTNLTNISAPLGSTTFLHCKVNLLQDKTVSWLKRDAVGGLKLLTFGLTTYSGDERLSINFEQPNDWKLRISAVDKIVHEGLWYCQVSSHPPLILQVTLTVIVPKISIVDDLGKPISDKFYNAGSTLELRCIVTHFPILYTILWRQGNKTLNYDTSRGGISVKTTTYKERVVSVLAIANARKNDSGPYICSLGNLTQNHVHVHVINGEVPAAMQHSHGPSVHNHFECSNLILALLLGVSMTWRSTMTVRTFRLIMIGRTC